MGHKTSSINHKKGDSTKVQTLGAVSQCCEHEIGKHLWRQMNMPTHCSQVIITIEWAHSVSLVIATVNDRKRASI